MGKFKPGHQKLGGRQKGVPNKKRSIFESMDGIVTQDGEPVDVVKMFFHALQTLPPNLQVNALLDFMQFIYPKQKSMEVTSGESEPFRVVIHDYSTKQTL